MTGRAEVAGMRWAFWRPRQRRDPTMERPLPAEVGLPVGERPGSPGSGPRDNDDEAPPRTGTSPFSGASPDPGARGDRHRPQGTTGRNASLDDAGPLDPESLQHHAQAVVAAVRAVLAGAPAAVDAALATSTATDTTARSASALATRALAARLPALSGITGDAVDEPEDDLLHAYADLLAERAEPLRRRAAPDLRDVVARVAHHAADAADARAGDRPPAEALRGVGLPDAAAAHQVVAACVLLAQTSRDGGGDLEQLASELEVIVADLTRAHGEPPG